jgi:hypothetical protein
MHSLVLRTESELEKKLFMILHKEEINNLCRFYHLLKLRRFSGWAMALFWVKYRRII